VQGQSGGGTQPKVEWTTEDNCTEIHIYNLRSDNKGKYDVHVTNTSGDINLVIDGYSLDLIRQNIIPIKGLDAEAHDVTITCRSDKHASSSSYWFSFQGCVELTETATDRAKPTLKYEISVDQDQANIHWDEITTEATTQALGPQKLYSGTGSATQFQVPLSTEPMVDVYKVELYIASAWVEQEEVTAWTHNAAEQVTVTFDTPPDSGTDNIRITYCRKGTRGKIRASFTYPTGALGIEEAYINDVGVYMQKL